MERRLEIRFPVIRTTGPASCVKSSPGTTFSAELLRSAISFKCASTAPHARELFCCDLDSSSKSGVYLNSRELT